MNFTIGEATKDCPREDCRIWEGPYTSTCIGWSAVYDKFGNRADKGDPNITSGSLKCTTCGASWYTRTQYGETTITKADPPSLPRQEHEDAAR